MRFAPCLTALCAALALSAGAQGATLKTLYSFCSQSNCADGSEPSASLLRDGNGNLFGTTFYGGTASGFDGSGVVFELSPGKHGTWHYGNLYTFCKQRPCTDGQYPNGNLIVDTSGNLYGEAVFGGTADVGVIFELSPAGTGMSYNILHDFSDAEGGNPAGGLTYADFDTGAPYDGASALYGAAQSFGANNGGAIYRFMPNAGSWSLTPIYSFSSNETGTLPVQNVTLDASGANIYGVTLEPHGSVFQLTDTGGGTWNETTLHTFPSEGDDTYDPFGSLLLDSSGSLIGTALDGGPHCKYSKHHGGKRCGGGVFKLSGGGANPTFSAIYDFCAYDKLCQDGAGPGGSLVMDSSGTIYGATAGGGKYEGGTIFRIRREQKLETIYDFCSQPNCTDGQLPQGVVLDTKGRLYGVTSMGGANNGGTVFELTP